MQLTGELMLHDPSIIQDGDTWYVFATGKVHVNGISRLKSDDGFHWSEMPKLLSVPLPWWSQYVSNHEPNQWAPDIKHYQGRYYLLYSVSSFGVNNSLIGMLSTTNIESCNWRDEGLVIHSNTSDNFNAIDGAMAIDANGTPWMSYGSFWSGIKLTQLDASLKPTGPVYSIAERTNEPDNAIEASNITYRDGYYYLFVSFDRCCRGADSTYKIAMGRSEKITGPYLDKSGTSMMNGGGSILESGFDQYVATGGQDVFENRLLVRHGYDSTQNGLPQLLISDLHWNSQRWPTLAECR